MEDSSTIPPAPPSPRPQSRTFEALPLRIPRLPTANLERLPDPRPLAALSFSWRQVPRKFILKKVVPRSGSGFAASAHRALLKTNRTVRPKKGAHNRVHRVPTKLKNEIVIKEVRFSERITEYDPPDDLGAYDGDELINPMLLDPQRIKETNIIAKEAPEKCLRVEFKPHRSFLMQHMPPTLISPEEAKQNELYVAKKVNPALRSAFFSRGPLNVECKDLVNDTMLKMEMAFRKDDTQRAKNWDKVADEFCGCTREEMLKWHISLGIPVEVQHNSSERVMGLLLRAFFDSQYTWMDEIACMEEKGSVTVAKELEREKRGCVRSFLAKARTCFEIALWRYFLSEWVKS